MMRSLIRYPRQAWPSHTGRLAPAARRMIRLVPLWVLFLMQAAAVPAADAPKLSPSETAFFENKIRPVLVQHCYKCHSAEADKVKGELFLDSRAGLRKGGESGPALIP